MNTTAEANVFHPYTVISQGRSTIQLQAAAAAKIIITVLRFIPLLLLVIGVILYLTQKESFYLFVFGGMALIEVFAFSFVRIPTAISMDNMGLTLEMLSTKGRKEVYYLWSDVDYIQYRSVQTKNSNSLNYAVVLKTGKRQNFLTFQNYHSKKTSIPQINSILEEISRKDVQEK